MKRIVIVTATRAEYGLLKPLMLKFRECEMVDMKIAVTGMHLSPEFGMTVNEIESDGIGIDKKIEILMSSDTPVSLSKSMGLALISFAEYFNEIKPDALIVLGDRFETLAVCAAATNARIPIFHLHGGEATDGLIDEAIRHSITKMSYLHFASTDEYRKRIVQMGENPSRVFNVGAMGVENALSTKMMSLEELENSLEFKLGCNYAVGTFHPVTLEDNTSEDQIKALLGALDRHRDMNFLFTMANADTDGRIINEYLQEYSENNSNFKLVRSLGVRRYMSALKYAKFVIGNSSSGLIEAPSFHIPTIDIGDRQKGRIRGETVIHCEPNISFISNAINQALNPSFREEISCAINPYGDGETSDKIFGIVCDTLVDNRIDLKKEFYDIEFKE